MSADLTRGMKDVRGAEDVRGDVISRGELEDRMDLTRSSVKMLTRSVDSLKEDANMHADCLTKTGKKLIGAPIVVFPNNIAGGSYVPGTIVRLIDGELIQVSVGKVVIQDGAWKPVAPFVAGDQVFIPLRSIDAFVL